MAEAEEEVDETDPEPTLLDELSDKLLRSQQNLAKMEEAEAALLDERAYLLKQLETRVGAQGHMETFVSDEITSKAETARQLQRKLDRMTQFMLQQKNVHEERVAESHAEHKLRMDELLAEINSHEVLLAEEHKTRQQRDVLTAKFEEMQARLIQSKQEAVEALGEFEEFSKMEIARLVRKETVRNKGVLRAFQERHITLNQQAGSKAVIDNVENRNKVLENGEHVVKILEANAKLEREHQELRRELETRRFTKQEAESTHEKLKVELTCITRRFWEAEDRIQDLKASIASSSTVDPVSAECASLKATLSQTQADAKARRDELRSVLSESQQLRTQNVRLKQEARDMFAGDSVAWGIITALPAIWSGSRAEGITRTARNEQELDLLLSALRVATIHEQFSDALNHESKPTHEVPKIFQVTSRHSSSYAMSTSILK